MKYAEETKQKAVKLYQQGQSTYQIAGLFGCTAKSISNWLYQLGITPRLYTYTSTAKYIYEINDSYFEIIDTPTKAYWIGFILADGCIREHHGGYRLEIELQTCDYNHLEKFLLHISSTHPIRQIRPNSFVVAITNAKLCKDLIKLGITPRKTFTAQPIEISSQLKRDYYRGLIDGDGCIHFDKSWALSLAGTKEIVTDFSKWLGCKGKYVYPAPGCYTFHKRSKSVVDILHKLYGNATIYLDRKYELYTEAMKGYTLPLFPDK